MRNFAYSSALTMGDNSSVPFYHGYSVPSRTKTRLDQTLYYAKGCPQESNTDAETARRAIALLNAQNSLLDNTIVELTYGKRKPFLQKTKLPYYVTLDKQVLRFFGFFKELINDTWSEEFRIHHVKVQYYLVDDTIEVIEPIVVNSGLPQGVLIRRQKIPHPDGRRMYSWTDFNIRKKMAIYGRAITLTDCDPWTKEYMESSGIVLEPFINDIPIDPYTKKAREKQPTRCVQPHCLAEEKLWKFLNMDGQVLRFFGLWDDICNVPMEKRKVIIRYYLVDDTLEMIETHTINDGRENGNVLVGRQRIPVDMTKVPKTFPSAYLELSGKEISEWFRPDHFVVGNFIVIYKRKILLYDCDIFTRHFYKMNYGKEQPDAVDIEPEPKEPWRQLLPPHNGYGTWEDSLQSCLHIVPKPPKKDILKALYNDNKILRFAAKIVTVKGDHVRKFVITFFPGDDTVQINEVQVRNSGFGRGLFLRRCRLAKPTLDRDNRPQYYDASDFYIGATIDVHGWLFEIHDADRYVLRFMEANPNFYTDDIIKVHQKKAAEIDPENYIESKDKAEIKEMLRDNVKLTCGLEPLRIPLDLGFENLPNVEVRDRLHEMNLPLTKTMIEKAIEVCTLADGMVDIRDLSAMLLYSFGL